MWQHCMGDRDARIHRLEDKIKYKSSGIHRLKTNTNTHQEEIWEWEGRHCMESWESHFVLFVRNMYGWGGRGCQIKTKKWKTNTNTNEQRQIQPLRYKHKYEWKWGACTFCPRPSSSIQVFREQLHSSTRILIRTDLEAFHPSPHQNEGKDFNVKYFRHDFLGPRGPHGIPLSVS